MYSKKQLLVVFVLSLLLSACLDKSGGATPVSTSVIIAGEHPITGLQVNRKIEVFSDQTSLNANFADYVNFVTEQTVDFTTKRVVLLGMGTRNSGGHSIAVESAEDFGNYVQLNITLTIPGNGCIVTLALTSPFQFVEINSTKNLIFKERVSVYECIN